MTPIYQYPSNLDYYCGHFNCINILPITNLYQKGFSTMSNFKTSTRNSLKTNRACEFADYTVLYRSQYRVYYVKTVKVKFYLQKSVFIFFMAF